MMKYIEDDKSRIREKPEPGQETITWHQVALMTERGTRKKQIQMSMDVNKQTNKKNTK